MNRTGNYLIFVCWTIWNRGASNNDFQKNTYYFSQCLMPQVIESVVPSFKITTKGTVQCSPNPLWFCIPRWCKLIKNEEQNMFKIRYIEEFGLNQYFPPKSKDKVQLSEWFWFWDQKAILSKTRLKDKFIQKIKELNEAGGNLKCTSLCHQTKVRFFNHLIWIKYFFHSFWLRFRQGFVRTLEH
jgi:hypothetical protein